MQMNEMHFTGVLPIDGYGSGFFRIGGQVFHGPILLRAGHVGGWGGMEDAAPLLSLAGRIDVLLLGTGADIAPVPPALREAVEGAGIGVEQMATPPACRTYNVLLAEERRIAAALMPVA